MRQSDIQVGEKDLMSSNTHKSTWFTPQVARLSIENTNSKCSDNDETMAHPQGGDTQGNNCGQINGNPGAS